MTEIPGQNPDQDDSQTPNTGGRVKGWRKIATALGLAGALGGAGAATISDNESHPAQQGNSEPTEQIKPEVTTSADATPEAPVATPIETPSTTAAPTTVESTPGTTPDTSGNSEPSLSDRLIEPLAEIAGPNGPIRVVPGTETPINQGPDVGGPGGAIAGINDGNGNTIPVTPGADITGVDPNIAQGNANDTAHGPNGGMPTELPNNQ